jgi:hypothetical protein
VNRKVLFLLGISAAGWCNAQSVSAKLPVWEQFRQTYPFHTQLVALSEPDSDGHRIMILSEPPPHVTVGALEKVLGRAALKSQILKHPVGFDGWVKDIVIELEALPESRINELVSAVHWYAFGTTYKASALMLPATGLKQRHTVDLSFTMNDLEEHVLASQELFSNPEMGAALSVEGLLRTKKLGIFYSNKPGIVVWIVARGGDLSRAGKMIRQFALDSDLILGAAANDTHVAIVARERSIPIEWLPPLRAETIVLLASAEGTQLAQSYERTYIYAGPLEKNLDWAPIYLSPVLIDTEYGSLLNVTDQLLKSWSESGKVTYWGFTYPHPGIPFPFTEGLYREAQASRVTYNWNTSGFGYVLKRSGLESFAVNRTGALPVSYLTGKNSILREKEDSAYQFFASTNDPNLARVVQYSTLYQIFRRYKMTAPKANPPAPDEPEAELVAGLRAKLDEAMDVDLAPLEQRMTRLGPEAAQEVRRALTEFRQFQSELREMQKEPLGLKSVAECLASGRFTYDCNALLPKGSHLPAALALSSNQYFWRVVLTQKNRQEVMRAVVAKNEHRDNGWIKTPSVVMSSNPGMTGGHNIGASVVEFRTNPALKAGEVRIVEENGRSIINLSESDHAKSSSTMPWLRRAVENRSGATRADIEAMLAKTEVAKRPRDVALGIPLGRATAARVYEARNTVTAQRVAGYTRSGTVHNRAIADHAAKLGTLGLSLVVSRESANSYSVIEPIKIQQAGLASTVAEAQVRDLESVTELLANSYSQGNFGVHLKGITPEEALAFKKTAEFRIEAQTGKKVEINAFVESDGALTEKSFAMLSETHYDLSHPKISAPEIVEIKEGPSRGTQVDYKLEFTSVTPTRPSLLLRIRLFFAENVIRPAQQILDAAIGRALLKIEAMRGRALPVNNRLVMIMIKSELTKVCPPDADMHIELGDIYMVKVVRPAHDDISDRKVG